MDRSGEFRAGCAGTRAGVVQEVFFMSGEKVEDSVEKQAQERVELLRGIFASAVRSLEWTDEPAPVFRPDVPKANSDPTTS